MWLVLAVITLMAHAGGNVWMSQEGLRATPAAIRVLVTIVCAFPVFVICLWVVGVPEVKTPFWYYFAADVVLIFVVRILYMRALSLGSLAQTQPILSLTPALMVIVTYPLLTGRQVPAVGWVGVVLITIGIFASQHPGYAKGGLDWFVAPFKAALKQPGVRLKFIVATIYAFTASIDQVCIDTSNWAFYLVAEAAVVGPLMFAFVAMQVRMGRYKVSSYQKYHKKLLFGGAIGATLSAAQYAACSLAPVPYIIAIKRLSIILSSGWAIFVREDHAFNWFRVTGVLIAVLGVVLITLS